MKNNLLSFVLFLCCAAATQFFSQRVWAQTTAATGMTEAQWKAVKDIKIANLDKDTYFKSGGFILDRYEERPAYVFAFSDGITRKIYLYKVFAAEDTKELGLLAIYKNEKSGEVKPFVIPGATADRKAWDLYIDELKYVGEKEPGLMPTLTFVLSREMAGLLAGGGAKSDEGGDKKKEEYNFCFAADAPVTLADGSSKAISNVTPNDVVISYDAKTKTLVPTNVTRVDRHEGEFKLTAVWLVPTQELTADMRPTLAKPMLFEATANHPVMTVTGRKALGNVTAGELMLRYDAATQQVVTYKVVKAESEIRAVNKVYNLATQSGAYLVGDVVVLDK